MLDITVTPSDRHLKRLAVLDVEGIILPKRRYLLLHAINRVPFPAIFLLFVYGFLYHFGLIPLDKALRGIYALFRGIPLEEFYQTFGSLPMIPGVQDVVQYLKVREYRIALISSGIPHIIVNDLAKRLDADYAYGLGMEVVNNRVTGNIYGEAIESNGKAVILSEILKEQRYSREHCLVIADDRNNLPMFLLAGKTIGYNPDPVVAIKCDYAVKGNLRDVIPYLDIPITSPKTPYTRNDIYRAFIHVGSFLIPLVCHFFNIGRYTLTIVIFTATILYIVSEMARQAEIHFPPFTTITNHAAIGEEQWGFATAPLYFALGILLSLTVFPPHRGYTAIAILTLGDGTAKIVGKQGRRSLPYNKTKTLEGTASGMVVSILASSLFVTPYKALIVSVISMLVESLPLPIDDNIMIPTVAGMILLATS